MLGMTVVYRGHDSAMKIIFKNRERTLAENGVRFSESWPPRALGSGLQKV